MVGILVGVPAEDVLDDHDGLLDDVVQLGLDQLQQYLPAHACFRPSSKLGWDATNLNL